MVGPSSRHHRRPRRHGLHDARVREPRALKVEHFPYVLPEDWRPTDFAASYKTATGTTIELTTAFPVADTKATGPRPIVAEAVWVGVGAGADFLGRDVKGKAVIIYSTFVPGGRSHSASDRAGLFNANARAVQLGAAVVVNVMAVPGNGQFQPEGGLSPGSAVHVEHGRGLCAAGSSRQGREDRR